jgi:hypothetical protein
MRCRSAVTSAATRFAAARRMMLPAVNHLCMALVLEIASERGPAGREPLP